jgi:hypothetical protein
MKAIYPQRCTNYQVQKGQALVIVFKIDNTEFYWKPNWKDLVTILSKAYNTEAFVNEAGELQDFRDVAFRIIEKEVERPRLERNVLEPIKSINSDLNKRDQWTLTNPPIFGQGFDPEKFEATRSIVLSGARSET